MFRADDYNSNIVKRFPVKYESDVLSITSGGSNVIFTSSQYFPGSEIFLLRVKLEAPATRVLTFSLNSLELFTYSATPNVYSGNILPADVLIDGRLLLAPGKTLIVGVSSSYTNLIVQVGGISY